MATLYLRNVDDAVYRRLRERARKRRRSITQEALSILENSLVSSASADVWDRVDMLREEARRRYGDFGRTESLIREDRAR